jgi:hypothetical protein
VSGTCRGVCNAWRLGCVQVHTRPTRLPLRHLFGKQWSCAVYELVLAMYLKRAWPYVVPTNCRAGYKLVLVQARSTRWTQGTRGRARWSWILLSSISFSSAHATSRTPHNDRVIRRVNKAVNKRIRVVATSTLRRTTLYCLYSSIAFHGTDKLKLCNKQANTRRHQVRECMGA